MPYQAKGNIGYKTQEKDRYLEKSDTTEADQIILFDRYAKLTLCQPTVPIVGRREDAYPKEQDRVIYHGIPEKKGCHCFNIHRLSPPRKVFFDQRCLARQKPS